MNGVNESLCCHTNAIHCNNFNRQKQKLKMQVLLRVKLHPRPNKLHYSIKFNNYENLGRLKDPVNAKL